MMKKVFIAIILEAVFSSAVYSIELDRSILSFPSEDVERVFSGEKLVFNLKESTYRPNYEIKYIHKNEKNGDDIENAVTSRFSAIKSKDLDWWKKEWVSDKQAQESLIKMLDSGMKIDALLDRWGNITEYNNLLLTRKISYKEYRIVMYKIISKSTNNNEVTELSIVLKKRGTDWKVTSDLSKSPLMGYMPWVSGRYDALEENSLWVLE